MFFPVIPTEGPRHLPAAAEGSGLPANRLLTASERALDTQRDLFSSRNLCLLVRLVSARSLIRSPPKSHRSSSWASHVPLNAFSACRATLKNPPCRASLTTASSRRPSPACPLVESACPIMSVSAEPQHGATCSIPRTARAILLFLTYRSFPPEQAPRSLQVRLPLRFCSFLPSQVPGSARLLPPGPGILISMSSGSPGVSKGRDRGNKTQPPKRIRLCNHGVEAPHDGDSRRPVALARSVGGASQVSAARERWVKIALA